MIVLCIAEQQQEKLKIFNLVREIKRLLELQTDKQNQNHSSGESQYIRMRMLPTACIITALCIQYMANIALLMHPEIESTDQRHSVHQPDYFSRTAY